MWHVGALTIYGLSLGTEWPPPSLCFPSEIWGILLGKGERGGGKEMEVARTPRAYAGVQQGL